MEERQLKRLLIIVAISIAIIMGFKMMLTDSLTTMNQTAAKKKLATPAPPQPAIEPPVMLEPVLFPPEPVAASIIEIIEQPDDAKASDVVMIDTPATTNEDTYQH
jgi:hypothetical protein